MNWEALSSLSDLTAALAVIVTLPYVALQIRQNTLAIKSSATASVHDEVIGCYDLLAEDGELSDIFVHGLFEIDSLNGMETGRLFAFILGTLFRLQNFYQQVKVATVERELFESWCNVLRQASGTPGFQGIWAEKKHLFMPDFIAYMETQVFRQEPDPDYRPLGVAR